MTITKDELEQANIDYNDGWGKDETTAGTGEAPSQAKPSPVAPKPAENAVVAAAAAARDSDAKEFSDAFNAPAAPEPKPEPAPKNFKEAFAQARADGLKVFDWNGKKYTTELKPKAPAVAIVIAPSAASPMTDKAAPIKGDMMAGKSSSAEVFKDMKHKGMGA